MIRIVPLVLAFSAFWLIWFLDPSWPTLIVAILLIAFLAWRFMRNPKNYS